MTNKEKEINKNNLIMEGLGIFMVGSLEDLNSNLESLCLKYFPHKNIFVLNAFYEYFSALLAVVFAYESIEYSMTKYE